MTPSPLDYNTRQTSLEEQYLYDHLQDCIQKESPEEILERFRCLFVKGRDYQNDAVRLALVKIVNSRQAEREFQFILNRCFYLVIRHWQKQPQHQSAIPQLIALCTEVLPPRGEYYRTANRLRKLMSEFVKTDQYSKLQRLGWVFSQNRDNSDRVNHLIYRYPYLYENCLLSEDNDYENLKVIWRIQKRVQHQFELDLSQYVTYKVRLEQMKQAESKGKALRPLANPTLLKESDFNTALKQFVGSIEGSYTHWDLSRSFLTHSLQTPSYKAFKDDLYEYLIASVDSKYGKHQFNEKLYSTIQSILPSSDSQKLNEFLLLRTSSRILNFLILESDRRPDHHVFVDLVTNLGATNTVSLLLKVVLLCSKVKPHLEKRVSILFDRYESYPRKDVPWLVKALENLHIALSVHFGEADLSCIKQII